MLLTPCDGSICETDGLDSGKLIELKQQFAIEGIDLRLLFVLLLRQGITRGGDVLRGEAEIDIAHLVEAAQEKARGDKQYKGDSYLRDHQSRAQASVASTSGAGTPPSLRFSLTLVRIAAKAGARRIRDRLRLQVPMQRR